MNFTKKIRGILHRLMVRNDSYGDDEVIVSARQAAFDCFERGIRPVVTWHYLKELGYIVKKATIIRYFQDWKRQDEILMWRIIRKQLKTDSEFRATMAKEFGVSEDDFRKALINCSSGSVLRSRLGLPTKSDIRAARKKYDREIDLVIRKLRNCSSGNELNDTLESEAKRLGISLIDLFTALSKRSDKLEFQRKLNWLMNQS